MERMKLLRRLSLIALATGIWVGDAAAAELYVSPAGTGTSCSPTSPCSFQTALSLAQSNGEDDVIYVAPGTYNVTETLTYETDDGDGGHKLVIVAQDPEHRPVLDGGGSVKIMRITTDTGRDGGDGGGDITISGLIFKDGESFAMGAGLRVRTHDANVLVEKSEFEGNRCFQGIGGGAYLETVSGVVTVTGNRFSGNWGWDGAGGVHVAADSGSITFTNNFLIGNGAHAGGGGAALSSRALRALTFSDNIFGGNWTLGGFGGAAYMSVYLDDAAVFKFTGNIFYENESGYSPYVGGAEVGIYPTGGATPGTVTFGGNVFVKNSNIGLWLDIRADSVALEGNAFVGNEGHGLKVERGRTVTLTDNTFADNEGFGADVRSNIALLKDNTFMDNSYHGLWVGGSEVRLSGNTFIGNSGGSYVSAGELGVITGNIFRDNHNPRCGYHLGGGICVYDENCRQGPYILANNIFSGNSAKIAGALYIRTCRPITIVNNTFVGNSAEEHSGGVYIANLVADINIYNNIFWNNVAPKDGKDLCITSAGNKIRLYNNDFSLGTIFDPDLDPNPEDANLISGRLIIYRMSYFFSQPAFEKYFRGGNVTKDPMFAVPERGNFHLLGGSPCIDSGEAGAPELPEVDFEGDPRVVGMAADIGADEYNGYTPDLPPEVDSFVGFPPSGDPPLEVRFICVAHDPDGTIESYMWDFDGDGTVDETTEDDSTTYTYDDPGTYRAEVTVVDDGGLEASATLTVRVFGPSGAVPPTAVAEGDVLPKEFTLGNPYPNPFNSRVVIPFSVPRTCHVEVEVFDTIGRRVWGCAGTFGPGRHGLEWDGKDSSGRELGSGVYLVKFRAGREEFVRKAVMMK